ncbi:hypothetical protein JTB14_031312 [Gonioctena quinquepunctata]|nr:hypothetical protein JTB14_031312 [Gonioctena quinquepunctata]
MRIACLFIRTRSQIVCLQHLATRLLCWIGMAEITLPTENPRQKDYNKEESMFSENEYAKKIHFDRFDSNREEWEYYLSG